MSFAECLQNFRLLKSKPPRQQCSGPSIADLIGDASEHVSSADCQPGELALLMLIIDDLPYEEIWRRWIRKQKFSVNVYIHAKFPERVRSPWVREHLVPSDLCPEWGSLEIVEAELLLLDAATKTSSAEYFCFVSESCVPIGAWDVRPSHSLFDLRQGPENGYAESGQFLPLEMHMPRAKIAKASQWCLLTRDDTRAVLSVSSVLLPFFYEVHCADEMFFATVLSLMDREVEHRAVTYVKWASQCEKSPQVLEIQDVDFLFKLTKISRCEIFCRKVTLAQELLMPPLEAYNVI